jgi:hypothetical protein
MITLELIKSKNTTLAAVALCLNDSCLKNPGWVMANANKPGELPHGGKATV